MYLPVYGLKGKYIGAAANFGEAKQMQQDSLPEDLKEAYAGYQDGMPVFYTEMLTHILLEKYGLGHCYS